MIVRKFEPTICAVQIVGLVVDLYTGLTVGRPCFIGLNARLTQAVPTPPSTGVRYSQPIAYAVASNAVLLEFHMPSVRTATL